MGHKRITEKDFWKCTEGNMPAQLQSTQTTAKKSSGEKYITIKDTSTSSWIDFSCKKAMLIYAIIAAAAVVIAAMIVGTGGAALIALGALAGLAGAAWGAVIGALLCGQTAAKGRKWVEVPKSRMTAVQGVRQITGDCTMTCIVGGVITFDPQIKSWSQAIALGAGNYISGLMEGMMAGAAIGMGGAALSGGAGAFASGGARGLGQAALQFAKSAPMNVLRNIGASFGYAGAGASASAAYTTAAAAVGLRGLTAAQSGLTHYGSTGESGWGAAGQGVFGMETGMYHSVNNLTTFHNPETGAFEWQGTWQDVTGLALLLSPVHKAAEEAKGKGKGEEAPAQDGEPVQDGEEAVRDANINNETPEGQQGEHATFEADPIPGPEFETITLADGTKVKRLKPNLEYGKNGYSYKTDAQGRISEVQGSLKLEKGGRNPYAQRTVGKGDGRLTGDHGGHLIGDQFGGAGGKENMVPMDGGVNNYHSGEWGQMEKNWASELKNGSNVDVKIEPRYGDNTSRPTHFDITETINGQTRNITIFNE